MHGKLKKPTSSTKGKLLNLWVLIRKMKYSSFLPFAFHLRQLYISNFFYTTASTGFVSIYFQRSLILFFFLIFTCYYDIISFHFINWNVSPWPSLLYVRPSRRKAFKLPFEILVTQKIYIPDCSLRTTDVSWARRNVCRSRAIPTVNQPWFLPLFCHLIAPLPELMFGDWKLETHHMAQSEPRISKHEYLS